MRYVQLSTGSIYPYPDHGIDPSKKGKDWCKAYAQAAYWDWSFVYPKGVFANNGGDYEKFKMYALGKQPITQYKKWLGVDQQTNNTWLSIDWTVRPIISKYRDMAISMLMKQEYGIVATPIDITAKSDLDAYYTQMKAKLAVQQLLQQQGSELANHPMVQSQPGEPMDTEELEMRVQLGEQFNRAKDAEEAIELGFYENNYKHFRRTVFEDLFDLGLSGYKEWLGTDNKPKFRKVKPDNVVINYCRNSDFSDLVHAGELIDVSLIDLATIKDENGNAIFDDKQLQEFAATIAGKWGNPSMLGRGTGWFKPYDKFKCKVLDIAFYSYNDYSYRKGKDSNGNNDFRKADFGRGKKSDKYERKKFRVVYKCKWIVGTEYCYDWGLMDDQKMPQNPEKKSLCDLPFKFYAYNFWEMKAQSMMERLIPYLDEYQLTMLKIQNFKNRAVPSGWWIDLDALENVALNKGGANMQPKELLQMFFETGVLVGRSKDAVGNPQSPNWKPVIPIENTAASELAMFYQDIINTIGTIEKITGFNEITTGNPNPNTLVPGYEVAQNSTNNSLFPLAFAEKYLTEKLAEDVLLRMQQGIKKSGISGYARAINNNTLRFIEVSPNIALREYGIMLEDKSTDEQKMFVLQQLQNDILNGTLDTSDAILILNTHNIKQAQQILAYKVGKSKQLMQQQELQKIQLNNQGNQQAAAMTQQAQQQQLQMEYQFKLLMKKMEIEMELEKKRIEMESEERRNTQTNLTKEVVQHAANEGKVITQHLANQGDIQKQKIANQKPISAPQQ